MSVGPRELGLIMRVPEPAFPRLVCLVAALNAVGARVRIPALPHPFCLVAALADSRVAWSRRVLFLNDNEIVSVAGVTWPSSLWYLSPLACSGRQSPHPRQIKGIIIIAAAPLLPYRRAG
jgi:hypothetical protein